MKPTHLWVGYFISDENACGKNEKGLH